MSSGNKLNPFQIEDDKWEGDFYDDDDMDGAQQEVRGLLGTTDGQTSRPVQRLKKKKASSLPVQRIFAIFAGTTLLFWILLSATGTQRELPTTEEDEDETTVIRRTRTPHSTPSVPPIMAPPVAGPIVPTSVTTASPVTATSTNEQEMKNDDILDPDSQSPTEPIPTDDFVPADRVPQTDDDWNDDGTSLRPVDPKPKPLFFIVLGERHSGVDYMLDTLKQCYGNEHRYGSGYHRPAAWFQTNDEIDVEFRMDASMHYRVIVLLTVRNPYDWVQAMYHAPLYMGDSPFDKLKDFCRAPWTSTVPTNATNGFCQYNFDIAEVAPCLELDDPFRFADDTPVYELDTSTGTPYENILAFRAAKIRHWTESLPKSWGIDPMVVPMDNSHAWTDEFASSLLNRTEGEELCMPTAPYEVTAYDRTSQKFMEWMNATIDWAMEDRIGYSM